MTRVAEYLLLNTLSSWMDISIEDDDDNKPNKQDSQSQVAFRIRRIIDAKRGVAQRLPSSSLQPI